MPFNNRVTVDNGLRREVPCCSICTEEHVLLANSLCTACAGLDGAGRRARLDEVARAARQKAQELADEPRPALWQAGPEAWQDS
jgi:hypothetical protein